MGIAYLTNSTEFEWATALRSLKHHQASNQRTPKHRRHIQS